MRSSKFTAEHAIYLLIFLLAATLRFVSLGKLPLFDNEAGWALQALHLAQGSHSSIGPQPGYILLTSILFYFFHSSEFIARFWPALFGSALVFAPYLFRKQLGATAGVILAVGLALDPGMVAISRQANGLSMAITFSMLAIGFIVAYQPLWAGIFCGLALLGGPSLWLGWLGIVLAAIWSSLATRRIPYAKAPSEGQGNQRVWPWRQFLIWTAGTVLIAGTLMFFVPSGISAMAESLPAFLSGWTESSGVELLLAVVALFFIELLPLIFGLYGLFWGLTHKDEIDHILIRWFFVSLILILSYSGRSVVDLCWLLLPLWALAARQVQRQINDFALGERLPTLIQSALIFVLLIFGWMNFIGLPGGASQNPQDFTFKMAALVGSIILIIVVVALVGWGWGIKTSINGFLGGLSTLLLIYTLMALWHATELGRNPGEEIWQGSPYFAGSAYMMQTINDMSNWNTGFKDGVSIVVVDINSPALQWSLRNHPVSFTNSLSLDANPSMVITVDQPSISLASSYRGQAVVLGQNPAWELILPSEWLKWIEYRDAPLEKQSIVLWVRSDLFPGSETPATTPPGSISPDSIAPAPANP